MKWGRSVAVCLLLAAAFSAYNVRYPNYDPDQHIFGTMLLKDKNPELFQKDFFFSEPRYYEYYVPWFRAMAGWIVAQTQGVGLLRRYNLLIFPTTFFFLLGFYALFRRLTECEAASWAVALAALTARVNLSANAFGIGLAQSMYAYKLFFAGVPWIFYFVVRFQFSRNSVWAAFFLLGLISNFHPILGIALVTILLAAFLVFNHPRFNGLLGLAGAVALFSIGFLPFVWKYVQTLPPPSMPLTAEEFWKTSLADWGYFPLLWKGVRNFLMDAGPLMIFSAVAARKSWKETDRFFWIFGLAILGVSFSEAAILQAQSHLMNRPPIIDLEPLRATTFIYIPLLVWGAGFLTGVLKKDISFGRLSGTALFVLSVFLLFAQKEFPFRQIVREALLKGGLYSEKRIEIWKNEQLRWADLMELSAWARRSTDTDALFFHPHYDFRFHAQRAIVIGYKDGSMIARIGGATKVREWLKRKQTVEEALRSKDPRRVVETARQYACDFVVLRKGFGPLDLADQPVFENSSYRVYRILKDGGI